MIFRRSCMSRLMVDNKREIVFSLSLFEATSAFFFRPLFTPSTGDTTSSRAGCIVFKVLKASTTLLSLGESLVPVRDVLVVEGTGSTFFFLKV